MADPTQQQQASTTTTPANAAGGAASSGGTVDAGKAPDVASLQKELEALRAQNADLGKRLGETSKEAADRRAAAKAADDAKRAADEKAALDKGEFSKIIENREKDLATARAELEKLSAAAKRAADLEGRLKARLDGILPKLSESQRAKVAALDVATGLDFAEEFLALSAGPGAARTTTAGAPVATAAPQDLGALSGPALQAVLEQMKPEDRLEAVRKLNRNGKPKSGWFAS